MRAEYTLTHRDAAVLRELSAADAPMTPFDLAEKIYETWCWDSLGPNEFEITLALHRIGAQMVPHYIEPPQMVPGD